MNIVKIPRIDAVALDAVYNNFYSDRINEYLVKNLEGKYISKNYKGYFFSFINNINNDADRRFNIIMNFYGEKYVGVIIYMKDVLPIESEVYSFGYEGIDDESIEKFGLFVNSASEDLEYRKT